ncbi:hypothetical protein [Dyella choica]|uniref:Uncharacterized protein n=1 Tax=Dyella choica TaxID=1927959 RepID=A0A3S0WVL0_9GAMM|nr:hypothetical protein [Dyella choica]RUL74968.1 hypothetical protein EKH80_12880 [Dyella choica]
MGILKGIEEKLVQYCLDKRPVRVIQRARIEHDMDLEKFVAIANQLARPSAQLRLDGQGDPVAYWHGMSMQGAPVITFLDEGRWREVSLDREQKGRVIEVSEPNRNGIPLFESRHISLPPIDAIFLLGGPEIDAYLMACGWNAMAGYNDNFPDSIPSKYEKLYLAANCPLYPVNGPEAVRGGWNATWPDTEWDDFTHNELVLWTFREAEPWIEVYRSGAGFQVKQRIT